MIDRALAPLFVRVEGLLLLSFIQGLKVGATRAEGDPLHRPNGLEGSSWGALYGRARYSGAGLLDERSEKFRE